MSIEIPSDFGYVILAAVAPFLLNFWQMMKIGSLRRKHGIKYPAMTSDKHPDFNCAQRVHQNTLENVPFYLAMLLVSGVKYPCLAATFGFVWVVGRVVYSVGYYSGDPAKRMPGFALSMLGGLLPLLVLSVCNAGGLIGWW